MRIEFSKNASKFVSSRDKHEKLRLKHAIEALTLSPPQGDIKHLQGYAIKTLRLRVGQYRILFRYVDGEHDRFLFIADIDSRGGIYK